jgi:hypothetical protein
MHFGSQFHVAKSGIRKNVRQLGGIGRETTVSDIDNVPFMDDGGTALK